MHKLIPALLIPGILSAATWIEYPGGPGPGAGKSVVLVSGDEEYRSEEALVQLARILSQRHGFKTTVLFAIDPETGVINPHVNDNIPGLEKLRDADLMVIFTRWRQLPDYQLAEIDAYLGSGRPVIGMRTSTHAFASPDAAHRQIRAHVRAVNQAKAGGKATPKPPIVSDDDWGPYGHYGDGYFGPRKGWEDGFGRLVIGERWVAHHGHHKHESTRAVEAPGAGSHPILRGVTAGEIWGSTDVYTVRLPLPGDSKPLLLGRVIARDGEYNESDRDFGMKASDQAPVAGKNDPMMPIAWTKSYQIPGGKKGKVFSTTMGASTDLESDALRRVLVNAVYWTLEMEVPASGTDARTVGDFKASQFGNHPPDYWVKRKLRLEDLR